MSTQKLFKRIVTGVLTASIAFSSAIVQASAATMYIDYSNFKTKTEVNISATQRNADGMANYDEGIIVWVNGGKATYNIGNTGITVQVDGKTATIDATAYFNDVYTYPLATSSSGINADTLDTIGTSEQGVYSDGTAWFQEVRNNYGELNVATAKNLVWGLLKAVEKKDQYDNVYYAPEKAIGSSGTDKPATKDSTVAFTVGTGKVTAGKTAPATEVTTDGYVGLYSYDKTSKKYTLLDVISVDVRLAPATVGAYDTAATPAALKTVDVGLGQISDAVAVYPVGAQKAANTSVNAMHENSDYTVALDAKTAAFASVAPATLKTYQSDGTTEIYYSDGTSKWYTKYGNVEYAGDRKVIPTIGDFSKSITIGSTTNKTNYFVIRGDAINESGSTPKASKASVIITNNQSGKSAKLAVNVNNGVNSINTVNAPSVTITPSTTAAVTVTGKVYDSTKSSDGIFATPDNTAKAVTIKPQAAILKGDPTKADFKVSSLFDAKGKLITKDKGVATIKADKDNVSFTISLAKGKTLSTEGEYAVIAYGTKANQVVLIPLKAGAKEVEITVPVTVSAANSDGVWTNTTVTLSANSDGVTGAITTGTTVTKPTTLSSDGTNFKADLKIKASLTPGEYFIKIAATTGSFEAANVIKVTIDKDYKASTITAVAVTKKG